MAVIATFKALPFTAFQDPPGGRNDPFVLSNDDPAILLDVSIDDDDQTLDGDNGQNETPDDTNQIATVTDADGNLVSTDACYVEWTATYTGTNGQIIEIWRICWINRTIPARRLATPIRTSRICRDRMGCLIL